MALLLVDASGDGGNIASSWVVVPTWMAAIPHRAQATSMSFHRDKGGGTDGARRVSVRVDQKAGPGS